jgi:hypothetical protein
VETISWRAAFLINVPLALVTLLIVFRHVPESRDPEAAQLDLVGALAATAGLGTLVYGLIRSSSAGLGDAGVLASLAVGLLSLVAFVFVESKSREAIVPLSLFRSKDFEGASLVTFLFYMALTGSLYFVPFLLVQVHGYSALAVGGIFLPFVAIAFILGRLSGMVRRPLRGEAAAHSRLARVGGGLRAVRFARGQPPRLLLDYVLSGDDRAGLWDGPGDSAAHDRCAQLR